MFPHLYWEHKNIRYFAALSACSSEVHTQEEKEQGNRNRIGTILNCVLEYMYEKKVKLKYKTRKK